MIFFFFESLLAMNRSHEPDSSTSSLNRPVSIHLHNLSENANQNNQTSMYKQVFYNTRPREYFQVRR